MAKLKVYFEGHEELNILNPVWLVAYFGRGNFNWSARQVYIPLEAPYTRAMRGDFEEDDKVMSLSVNYKDLKHDSKCKRNNILIISTLINL